MFHEKKHESTYLHHTIYRKILTFLVQRCISQPTRMNMFLDGQTKDI